MYYQDYKHRQILNTCVISKVLHTVRFLFKLNLFYKIHLQAFNVISIVLHHSGPTLGLSCDSHKPVPIRPRWREVAVPML